MRIKALYGFGDLSESTDLAEGKLKAEYQIENLTKHVNNGQLYVEVDFPGEFDDIYILTRKIRSSFKASTGKEPQIIKTQCFY